LKCRHCGAPLRLSLVDLGTAPPSNAYLSIAALEAPEAWYPLRVLVCTDCFLVQTADFARASELFDARYAYFSSYSSTWLTHARLFVEGVVARFALDERSRIIEVGANDGYLLQYFKARGIPCLGIEPTASTAAAARGRGLEIVTEFFGAPLAARLLATGEQADLMVANNVLAHVPDINDFVHGFALLLKPAGIASFEFPHLLRLIEQGQFDTIYHEHFSYLSLLAVQRIFAAAGLQVFDVAELPTHGGSLRVLAQRSATGARPVTAAVGELLGRERSAGLATAGFYAGCQARLEALKDAFLRFLLDARTQGLQVAAYGAAAKGNTLLNYAGVRSDLVRFVADRNPAKQGHYLPGSRIPVVAESVLQQQRPDYVLILPWNLKSEVQQQLGYIRDWGGKFVTAVPRLELA
jgi:2-polyprenyl-3-methyl-5-hydroxy-6-metoxy-1,4-benzoquinol methylase